MSALAGVLRALRSRKGKPERESSATTPRKGDIKDATAPETPERRVDPTDGCEYTLAEFEACYGEEHLAHWMGAARTSKRPLAVPEDMEATAMELDAEPLAAASPPDQKDVRAAGGDDGESLGRRVDPVDGCAYTFAEFTACYGKEHAAAKWASAAAPPAKGGATWAGGSDGAGGSGGSGGSGGAGGAALPARAQEERRIDPADGRAYTRGEFELCYGLQEGGYEARWEAAAAATPAAVATTTPQVPGRALEGACLIRDTVSPFRGAHAAEAKTRGLRASGGTAGAAKGRRGFNRNNFLKGVSFSPDGTCLLTNDDGHALRLFAVSDKAASSPVVGGWGGSAAGTVEMKSAGQAAAQEARTAARTFSARSAAQRAEHSQALCVREAGTIYDYRWHPRMRSADPSTCVFAATAEASPVHMWDANTGGIRCSYAPKDQVDELATPLSLAFSPTGSKIYMGFDRTIRVFEVERPGSECEEWALLTKKTYRVGRKKGGRGGKGKGKGKKRVVREGQRGLISTLDVSPDGGRVAAGSYSGSVYVYDAKGGGGRGGRACRALGWFQGARLGVTHVRFTPDGVLLLAGGRKENFVRVWDLRAPGKELCRLPRECASNQRVSFDVDPVGGRLVATGGTDGCVAIYDLSGGAAAPSGGGGAALLSPEVRLYGPAGSSSSCSGVSFHPHFRAGADTGMLATCSGHRTLRLPDSVMDTSSSSSGSDDDNAAPPWRAKAGLGGGLIAPPPPDAVAPGWFGPPHSPEAKARASESGGGGRWTGYNVLTRNSMSLWSIC